MRLNEMARELKTAFYCVSTSGLFGFGFVDLGEEMTFLDKGEATTISESVSIATYLDQVRSQEAKITWNRRMRHKDHKMLLSAFVGQAIKEADPSLTQEAFTTLLSAKGHDGFAARQQDFTKLWKDLERF